MTCSGRGLAYFRGALLPAAALLLGAGPASAMESRSFVMSYFGAATSSTEGDCAAGLNVNLDVQYARNLRDLGVPANKVEELVKTFSYEGTSWDKDLVSQMMNTRARINGQPANTFAHPAGVADPHLNSVTGKVAYGFNLDGKGADDPKAFEDPLTHEKGVDNQMFRALGCIDPFRGTLEHGTAFWLFMWMAEKDSAPAWLITVSGEDLSKDGPVSIKFNRAMDVPKFNADGSARADMTYREDPDPRTEKNVYRGQVKNGMIEVTEHTPLHMMQDQLTFPYFDLANFHMRLATKADGTLEGFIGGYQPIEQIYFALGEGGLAAERNYSPELPGMYYLLRQLADANPDPKTGQNWSISATYHIKATEAFVAAAPAAKKAAVSHH